MKRSLAIAALALGASAARADGPGFLGPSDLMGARPLAMDAYRGIAPGNDGMFINPAALAARRRFTFEAQYLLDRAGDTNGAQWGNVSVVDSQTSDLTGGMAANRFASGDYQGWGYYLSLAHAIANGLYLGATGKYYGLAGPGNDRVQAATADVGLFWEVTSLVAVGVAGYNLVPAGHREVMPRMLGAGLSVGDDRYFHVALDWRGDFETRGRLTNQYAVGGEYLLVDMFPLRAGFLRDETLDGRFWSAGGGVVLKNGLAFDLGYRQDIRYPSHRALAGALKVFLPGQ